MNKQTRNLAQFLAMGLLSLAMPMAAMGQQEPEDPPPPPKEEPKPDDAKAPKSVSEVPADKAIFYRIDLTGEFGHEVTATPMKKILEDAKKWNPDYLVFYVNLAFGGMGQRLEDYQSNPRMTSFAFNQLETARQLQVLFTDNIRDDDTWKTRDGKKPQLIMWVKKAMGGAAFVPFVAPHIYYTSDGQHGGIGYLEWTLAGRGDWIVHEKLYAARLARAEGLAIKGGHEPKIVKAMARTDYVLSVSYVGGKPLFFETDQGDELLTDDGIPPDDVDTQIRGNGNDYLNLDSAKAIRLGLAKGIADTTEDLADELGVARGYVFVRGQASDAFQKWGREVSKAEREMTTKMREMDRLPIQGENAAERNAVRSRHIKYCNDVLALYKKYGEALNPLALQRGNVPEPDDLLVYIERMKQQIRQDR